MATALLPVIGKMAPDFALPSTTGETVSLKQYKGKKTVILYFYPKDDTPGCTKEACEFRDFAGEFEKHNAVIVGISTDPIESHLKFRDKHRLPFPLPGIGLFPHPTMPLHVIELRYRTMVRDALSEERMIALALLKSGWEQDYYGSPEFHPLGCLARFEEVEWLPNDCYDLKVQGVARVRFTRIVKEFPYRAARVEMLPQDPYTEDDPLIEMEKEALAATFERLLVAL